MTRRMVTLHDGREVDNYSEDWRAECEARHILKLGSKQQRHAYLDGVARKRGQAARDALADLVMAVWKARRMTTQDAA